MARSVLDSTSSSSSHLRSKKNISIASPKGEVLRKLRPMKEDEVIAGFLKNEFFRPEFDRYREQFHDLVWSPDFSDARENKLRRALLFLRRGRLWRELPADTEWWEVELEPKALSELRVFPRNHWLRFAGDGFGLTEMIGRIRPWVEANPAQPFAAKLRSLMADFSVSDKHGGPVLLIGTAASGPFTIIEGNHRIAAAFMISPPEALRRFRFLCGFSSRMVDCCWYRTDFSNLCRYLWNFVTYHLDGHSMVLQQELRAQMETLQPEAQGADTAG